MSIRLIVVLAATSALMLGTASVAQAETIVLQASGPSAAHFAEGKVLEETATITLVQGDSLRVLMSGVSRVIHGPYDGQARAYGSADASVKAWDGVLRPKPMLRAAATRGFKLPVPPSN